MLTDWIYTFSLLAIFLGLPLFIVFYRSPARKRFLEVLEEKPSIKKAWYLGSRSVLSMISIQLALALPFMVLGWVNFFYPDPNAFHDEFEASIQWIYNALPFPHLFRAAEESYWASVLFPHTTLFIILGCFIWFITAEKLLNKSKQPLKLIVIMLPFLVIALGNYSYWQKLNTRWFEQFQISKQFEIGIPANSDILMNLELTFINNTADGNAYNGYLQVNEFGKEVSNTFLRYGGTNFWRTSIEEIQNCVKTMSTGFCSSANKDNTEFQFYWIPRIGLLLASKNSDLVGTENTNDRQSYYLSLMTWEHNQEWDQWIGIFACAPTQNESFPTQKSISHCLHDYINADLDHTKLKKIGVLLDLEHGAVPITQNDQEFIRSFLKKTEHIDWIKLSILKVTGHE